MARGGAFFRSARTCADPSSGSEQADFDGLGTQQTQQTQQSGGGGGDGFNFLDFNTQASGVDYGGDEFGASQISQSQVTDGGGAAAYDDSGLVGEFQESMTLGPAAGDRTLNGWIDAFP